MNVEDLVVIDKEYLKKGSSLNDPRDRTFEDKLRKSAVILDKPTKVSSQDLVVHVKRALNIEKAAHVGTLDPNVSGVLPILLGRSVKLNHYLSKKDKEYIVLMVLHKEVKPETIQDVLKSFEGEIYQLPPKKSAVKRKPRKRKIYKIEIIEIDSNRYVLFKAHVEAGTYIRALCRDVGEKLGIGAHMQELRRIRSMNFSENEALNFYDFYERIYLYTHFKENTPLNDALTPIEDAVLRNFPVIYVKDEAASSIVYGANLYKGGIVMHSKNIKVGDLFAVFTLKGEFVALMRSKQNAPFRDPLVGESESVFLTTSEMPKLWK